VKIAFVGCGSAGRPLAVGWRDAGHEIGAIITGSAAEAVAVIGAGTADGSLDDAEVVVFATPDDALAGAARQHRLRKDQVAVHLSGSHPSTVLAPTGARTAGLHPLRAFANLRASVAALKGTYFFVEGEAADVAESLARDLGGIAARITTEQKTLYHAGAAMAANYVVALFACSCRMFEEAGVEPETASAALMGLALGALNNVEQVGAARGLTGPVARGEVDVIAAHLAAVDEKTRRLMVPLIEATIPLAMEKGTLSDEAAARIRALF